MNALLRSLLVGLALVAVIASARGQSFQEKYAACQACHGESGQSELPETPSLGGQPSVFVLYQLVFFRGGQRNEQPMAEIMKGASDDDLRAYAAAIEKLPAPKPPREGRDPTRFARGQDIADRLQCASCHNPDYSGRRQMPRLATQREDYLILAMRAYKAERRVGQLAVMPEIMRAISDADIPAVAHFFAYLP
jgi:cytochrome c553